jgi:ABC-type transporter MlaC component
MRKAFLVTIAAVLFLASASAFAAKNYGGPANQLRAHYNVYQMAQKFTPDKLLKIKGQVVGARKMSKGVARFMSNYIDWDTYAELCFKDWDSLNKKQKRHLVKLLKTLTIKRYADLVSPTRRFMIQFGKNVVYKTIKGKQYAKVKAYVTDWTSDAEAEMSFLLRKRKENVWTLCDVYVEGISKARTYRAELRKIFLKKGFKGVVGALKRSTAKYNQRVAQRK